MQSCILAVGAPVAETVVLNLFHVWHYLRPDIEVFGQPGPSWVVWCYFAYTQPMLVLAKHLGLRMGVVDQA